MQLLAVQDCGQELDGRRKTSPSHTLKNKSRCAPLGRSAATSLNWCRMLRRQTPVASTMSPLLVQHMYHCQNLRGTNSPPTHALSRSTWRCVRSVNRSRSLPHATVLSRYAPSLGASQRGRSHHRFRSPTSATWPPKPPVERES